MMNYFICSVLLLVVPLPSNAFCRLYDILSSHSSSQQPIIENTQILIGKQIDSAETAIKVAAKNGQKSIHTLI
jgi:hypothetical protein